MYNKCKIEENLSQANRRLTLSSLYSLIIFLSCASLYFALSFDFKEKN